MLGAILSFAVAIVVGVGLMYLALNKHARRETARHHWLWSKANTEEERQLVEGLATLAPLIGGVIVLSLAFVLMVTFIVIRFAQ